MLKRLRIAALLYLLLFVVGAQFFTARHMTDWDAPIWVDIYTIAGDDDPGTRRFIDNLSDDEFAAVEAFFAAEAERYGVALDTGLHNEAARALYEHTGFRQREIRRARTPAVAAAIGGPGFVGYFKPL